MAIFKPVKQYGSYNYIIEDPHPKYNRMFIENISYNVKDLSVRPNEYFQFQNNALQVTSYNAMSANFYDYPVVDTNGKYGNSWTDSRQNWPSQPGNWDPWLLCLDYNTIPRRTIYDSESDMTYFNYPRSMTTTELYSDLWHGRDLNSTPLYSATTQTYFLSHIYKFRKNKETQNDNSVSYIAINHDYTSHNIFRVTYTPNAVPVYTNIRGATTEIPFFIGTDDDGQCYFNIYNVSTHDNTIVTVGNDANTVAVTQLASFAIGTTVNWYMTFPSNIIHYSDDKKVYYTMRTSTTGLMTISRIIWDKVSKRFTNKGCSALWADGSSFNAGNFTVQDLYMNSPVNSNYAANVSNSWFGKLHAFSKGGNRYLSYFSVEKCIASFPTERWTTSNRRCWTTFLIDPNDDTRLLYHSHYEWPTSDEMPRSWVPINDVGDKIMVMQTGKTVTMSFSTTTGWSVTNTQSIDARAYAIDSAGRIYLITRGQAGALQTGGTADAVLGNGWNEIHLYNPDLSSSELNISIANNLQNYTGSPIQTNLNVSASNRKLLTSYNSIDRFNPYPYSPFTTGYSTWFQSANSDRIVTANNEDFNFRTGDFTIEFWMRSTTAWTSQTGNAGIVGHKYSDTTRGWQLFRHSTVSTDKLTFRFAGTTDLVSTAIPDATVWQHWAVVRASGVITIYCNGVASGSVTNAADIYDYVGQLNIGFSQTWSVYYNGWISNLRICKGLAVYTGNFTVPTATLGVTQSAGTNISAITSQCVLLTCNTNNIQDNSVLSAKFLYLQSLNSNLSFGHGTLSSDYAINTSNSASSTVPITITGTGAKLIKVSSASVPVFTTTAGSLHSTPVYESQSISYTIVATTSAGGAITYTLDSGSLPPGITLNSSTGVISGTLGYVSTNTTYTFSIKATDENNLFSIRQFSITNSADVITWSTPTANQEFGFVTNTNVSITLSSSSALADTITYSLTSGTLPTGVTLSGNTISGVSSDTSYESNITITATSTNTGASTPITFLLKVGVASITGGTITTVTENSMTYNIHTFTSSGNLVVNTVGIYQPFQVFMVGGGGGGGNASTGSFNAGGGGAGGFVNVTNTLQTGTTYTVTVGGGGNANSNGGNTTFIGGSVSRTALGGGTQNSNGGSGGGSTGSGPNGTIVNNQGASTQFSTYGYGVGFGGGAGMGTGRGGGGGGAGGAGGSYGGNGGTGAINPITLSTSGILSGGNYYLGGGGGGASNISSPGSGGLGGGGNSTGNPATAAATVNTGGGGGAGTADTGSAAGGIGGSGIVIIKYRVS